MTDNTNTNTGTGSVESTGGVDDPIDTLNNQRTDVGFLRPDEEIVDVDSITLSGPIDKLLRSDLQATRPEMRRGVDAVSVSGSVQPVAAGSPDEDGDPTTTVSVHARVVRVDRHDESVFDAATVIIADESAATRLYVGTHGSSVDTIDAFEAAVGEEVVIGGLAHASGHKSVAYTATSATDVCVVTDSDAVCGAYLSTASPLSELGVVYAECDTHAAAWSEIADVVCDVMRLASPFDAGGTDSSTTWLYIDDESKDAYGTWVRGGLERVKSVLADVLPESKNTSTHRREITELVYQRSRVDVDEFRSGSPDDIDLKWCVGVANGVLDLRDGVLHDHGPEWRLRSKIPVEYRPDEHDGLGDGLTWFLDSVCNDDEDRDMALAMAAHALMRHHDIKAVFPLIGPSNSGKTKWQGAVRRLVGEQNVKAIDFDDFAAGTGFETGKVRDVHLVVDDDASGKKAGDLNYLKKVSGGQEVGINAKYQALEDYRPYSTVTWISNDPAILGDNKGGGVASRIYPAIFPNRFTDDADDGHLDKIAADELDAKIYTDAELEGLLVAAAAKAREMYESGNPGSTRSEKERWELYRSWADAAHRFSAECLTGVSGARIRKDAVYETYVAWCQSDSADPMTKSHFWSALRKNPEISFEDGRWDGSKRAVEHVTLCAAAVDYAPDWVLDEYVDEIVGSPALNAHERVTRIDDLEPGPTGPVSGVVIERASIVVDWKEMPRGYENTGQRIRLQDESGRVDVIALDPDGLCEAEFGVLADVDIGDEIRLDGATAIRSRRGVRVDATTAAMSILDAESESSGDGESEDGESEDGEDVVDQNERIETIVSIIDELDDGDGVRVDEVLKEGWDAGLDQDLVTSQIGSLKRSGRVYEVRPGRLRSSG